MCKIGDFNTAIDRTFNRKVSTQRVIGTPGYQARELKEGDQKGYWPRSEGGSLLVRGGHVGASHRKDT